MDKYDGWVLESPGYRVNSKGYFLPFFFHLRRRDVIKHIDKAVAIGYKKWKKDKGFEHRIVKVKLVEVK